MGILTHCKKESILHFVGIGGIGMSGIAKVLFNRGYCVQGSDHQETETTKKLRNLGIKVFIGHQKENVKKARVVVISSAISSNNPEIIAAREYRIPVIPRAEMLGELMRGKVGIAVAGTHGKTTTTSMLATILVHAQLDPTLVIGGKVDSFGGNAKLGQGELVVVEADESDGSFLHLPATFGVITNIDQDHLNYFKSIQKIEDYFIRFVERIPFYGLVAVCGEDGGVKRCLTRFTKPYATYGFSEEFDLFAKNIEIHGFQSSFEVWFREQHWKNTHKKLGKIKLSVPGNHNILNALASILIALQLKIPFSQISQSLEAFQGVRRRFEIKWSSLKHNQMIIDDYGHHPVEMAATLQAIRTGWQGRIITVVQPHRYTRTLDCWDHFDFGLSQLSQSDIVFMMDIYPAGEPPILGVNAERLVEHLKDKIPAKVIYGGGMQKTIEEVLQCFSSQDLVICFGAGSITHLSEDLAVKMKNAELSMV